MASTYSNLKIQLMATGENNTTWGDITNTNLGTAMEEAITGTADVAFVSANVTLTLTNTNGSQTARNLRLNCTGTTGGVRDLIVPAIEKVYIVNNGCADAITIKNSTGTGVAVPAGKTMWVFNNATDVVDVVTALSSLYTSGAVNVATTLNVTGATSLSSLGIGMNPVNILDITQNQNSGSTTKILNNDSGSAAYSNFRADNGTYYALMRMYGTGYTTAGSDRQNGMLLYTNGIGGMTFQIPSDAYRWYVGGTSYLSMTSSLLTFVGASGISTSHGLLSGDAGLGGTLTCTGFGYTAAYSTEGLTTTNGNGIRMVCVSAGVILNNGASAWAAISDYRAKNVMGPLTNSGYIIDAVPVHLAALKETPENVKAMFLAHEVQAVLPYAVHGEKDGEKMQVLESTDPLVPIMWEEIRQLRARLAALEAR